MSRRLYVLALALSLGPAAAACHRAPAPGPAAPASAAPELGDPTSETIGGITLGTPETKVVQILGAPAEKGPPQEMAATGDTLSSWRWASGVEIEMSGTAPPLTVDALTISAPSKLTTSRGVGIGAARADVERIYKPYLGTGRQPDEPDTTSPELLIIGSIYGGTAFRFADGKVTQISIGGGSE